MKALILVDIQNDFCPGGKLAVKGGSDIIPFVNALMEKSEYHLIIATIDWHPADHKSFASNNTDDNGNAIAVGSMGKLGGHDQVMWPDHCVQNTDGAKLHKDLNDKKIRGHVNKGTNPEVDSYSGFFDNDKKTATELNEILLRNGIKEIDVVGLALDYCVKATAIDGKNLGYKTTVLLDGTRAVNLHKDDAQKAVEELLASGIEVK